MTGFGHAFFMITDIWDRVQGSGVRDLVILIPYEIKMSLVTRPTTASGLYIVEEFSSYVNQM